MKLRSVFLELYLEAKVNKASILSDIVDIDSFVEVVNNMEQTPQRGFSYKPKSAIKIPTSTLLFHSTTKERLASILNTGFKGKGAYYSSNTKTITSKEHVVEGFMAFAFTLKGKKVDSRTLKGFLYGAWGVIFTAGDACKVYNTADKQYQVVFDVNKEVDIKYVVTPKIDPSNSSEWVWDVYDKQFNLLKEDIKLANLV